MSLLTRLFCAALVFGVKTYTSAVSTAAAAAVTMLLVVLIDYFAEPSTTWIARMYARRQRMTGIISGVFVAIGAGVVVLTSMLGASRGGPAASLTYVVIGILLGVVLRTLMASLFSQLLRGNATSLLHVHLHLALATVVILLPMGPAQRTQAGWFLIGIGAGFYAHFWSRRREHRDARRRRLLHNVVGALRQLPSGGFALERRAMEAYARQRWHDLNRIIVSSPRQRTFLELLRAAQARYVGDYTGAVDVLRQELARDKGTREYDNLLHLALALSLGDRGDRAETYEHLQEALRLQPTCRLCLSTLALRRAEDIALSDAAEPRAPLSGDQSLALAALTKALHGAPIPHSERVEALLVGSMAAMTRILLLDIQAYVLLKTGFAATVAPMLQQCVHEDPYFASGYLHLGEYYLIRRVSRDRAKTGTYPAVTGQHSNSQADLELWLATLCIEIALELEAGRDSLVARRARELLAAARAERPVIALDCYRPQGPGSGSVGASAA